MVICKKFYVYYTFFVQSECVTVIFEGIPKRGFRVWTGIHIRLKIATLQTNQIFVFILFFTAYSRI